MSTVAELETTFDHDTLISDKKLVFSAQSLSDRFLSRSLSDFLNFGQFLYDTKEEGSFKELVEIHGSLFLNSVITFADCFENLPSDYQQRLLSVNCSYWTVSCLRKLPKIPLEQYENFLNQVEAIAQSVEVISIKQIETITRQFLIRRRNHLVLGQLATEEDWQLVAEKLQLSEEQLKGVQFQTFQSAQVNSETGETEFKTDEIIKALELCGIAPDLLLSQPVRLKRRVAIVEAENLQLKQEKTDLCQENQKKEQTNLDLKRKIIQLHQQLSEYQLSSPGKQAPSMSVLPSTKTEISKSSQSKPSSFTKQEQNVLLRPQNQKPFPFFNEEPLQNVPVRVIRDGSPAETGKLIGSTETGNKWQVLLDEKNELGIQTIGDYEIGELEIKYPADGEFKPFFQALMKVGTSPELAQFSKDFTERSFLQNHKEVLSSSQPRKRKTAKGFGCSI